MKKLFKNLLCLLAFGWILPAQAQMTIQNGNEVSITNILQELVGQGILITNVKIFTGGAINNTVNAKRMYGIYKYTATPDLLGLTSGLVMSSGRVISEPNIVGINASSGSFASHDMGFGADPYLPASLDAIAIEFDMVPVAPIMYFNYMFASEEYPEYVCTPFNDIFKFVVSGPNPSDANNPYTFVNTNIAVIPNSGVPGTQNPGTDVAINTVHQGSLPGGQGCPSGSSNPQYHNKNADNLTVFDQRTKGLFAKLPVTPLATYKLRLIVGDRGDRIFDTGVFIEKVNTNIPAFNADIVQSTKLNKNEVLEGTETTAFSINRPWISQGTAETFTVEAVGTATPQADFELYEGTTLLTFPYTVNFSANELLKTYTLKIKNDVTAENTEDFTFNIKSLGGIVQHTVSYKIMGADTFFQNTPTNFTRCTPEQVLEFEAPLADSYAWDAPAGSYTCLTPDCRKISINAQAQPLTLVAKLGFGTITAANSSIVQNITIQPNYLQVAGNTPICEGTSIRLTASGRDTYQWSPAIGLSCTNCPNPIASPTTTTTYALSGTSTSCANSTISVQVQVVSGVPAPTFVGLNDSYCINSTEVALATTSAGGTFTVNGQNATAFSPTALGVGTHTITYQKQEATCLRVMNKSVTVIQGQATVNTQPNSQFIDLNSGVTFTVAATGNTTLAYQWQEKVGTASFVNLANTAPYSGVNTPTLSIASVNMTFNSRQYRCVLTACATAVNSNPATLDVNPLSLASATLDAQITLSPNPTKDKVWLKTKQNAVAEIEVFTSEGKFLSKITPERINAEQYELSLAKFNKGTYLLKVMVGKEFTIKRIVKE